MKRGLRWWMMCCALAGIGALFQGCGASPTAITAGLTAAQVGATAYVRGELRSALLIPLDDANSITHEMLCEVEMPVQWQRRDENKHVIRALRTQDRTVTITLHQQSPAVTRIGIRVGLLGDEAVALLLFERLQERYEEWEEQQAQGAS